MFGGIHDEENKSKSSKSIFQVSDRDASPVPRLILLFYQFGYKCSHLSAYGNKEREKT